MIRDNLIKILVKHGYSQADVYKLSTEMLIDMVSYLQDCKGKAK